MSERKSPDQLDADAEVIVFEPEQSQASPATSPAPQLNAKPFIWRDPSTIPARPWLYGRHTMRGYLSAVIAPGGSGKSSLMVVEALAMVTGRGFLGHEPPRPLRVWYWNLEDDPDELARRFTAAMMRFNVKPEEIAGRLFVNGDELIVASETRDGVTIAMPTIEALISEAIRLEIDVLIIDPFVSSHEVSENDNAKIDRVVKGAWRRVAMGANCAVTLVHHARKSNGAEVTAEASRGASALTDATRFVRVLNFMTEDEKAQVGVENRLQYVRISDGKNNFAARTDKAEWIHLEGQQLANTDWVAVVTPWRWPDMALAVNADELAAIRAAISKGQWRENAQAADWVGQPICRAMGLDPDIKADRTRVKGLIKRWIADGWLEVVEGLTQDRKKKPFIELGKWPL